MNTQQIQSLETELGAKLFNRTTRSVSLTQVGFQFLPLSPSTLPCLLPWIESPHAPMGIYYRQQSNIDKNSAIYKFISMAKDCAATALPCSK